MNWTEKQKQVIETRNRNLLVSAAAGSGKTAVLVERILRLITDVPDPADLDQLLVMTFTNAAAAEMRERIFKAIEKRLEERPEDPHLQVQAALVPYAQITTIDSFCLNLIREHFGSLDLDPAFRIGDEGELVLLQGDVMEQLLEDHYEAADPGFLRFVETFASGKSDAGIEERILQVHAFARSHPFPEGWFEDCRRELDQEEEGDLEQTRWMAFLLADARRQLGELEEQMEAAAEICREDGGPACYLPAIAQDLEMIRRLRAGTGDYRSFLQELEAASFGRLAAARSKDIVPEKKEAAGRIRERAKKTVTALKELYGLGEPEQIRRDLKTSAEAVRCLLDLAEEFDRRYQEAKKDKNLVDFGDLEHCALRVLARRENGRLVFTETADQLSRQYREILVDEYQDSNYVQETLIQSLSGERFGRPDVFMVGDVKQSIYRFRLARPELFMEKYHTYTVEESGSQKIELRQNFRSRPEVLESVNYLFYQIMTEGLGNVDYTEDAALYPGAVFPPREDPEGDDPCRTELILMDTGKQALGALDEEAYDYTSREMEARAVAARIRQLVDPETGLPVWDGAAGKYRKAEYGDIVILLRSISGWSEAFINVLTQEGIPAMAETGTGYFDTVEVETVLAMLAVTDNPMQDIPLAAVLKSPAAGVTEEELAWMMAAWKRRAEKGEDRGVYAAFRWLLETEEEIRGIAPGLKDKLRAFDRQLQRFRRAAAVLPVHELLQRIYEETGYYDYVSAMPAGETRRANLDMLLEKASAYEKTSYKGLFQFIRYIHKLKKYETDFGEASAAGRYGSMVRIMSVHKSKGLEFPIVVLAGLGKGFNRQDVRGKILLDPDLGIAADSVDLELRVKAPTLKKQALRRKMELDSLGEELRVLYVAMTRAKEKLILVGTDRSLEKKLEKWGGEPSWGTRQIPCTVLASAGSFLDWILMAAPWRSGRFQIQQVSAEELVGEAVIRRVQTDGSLEALRQLDLGRTYDEAVKTALDGCFGYQYPYQADIDLHTVISVSERKKAGQEAEGVRQMGPAPETESLGEGTEETAVSGSRQEDRKTRQEAMERAARRGSAYHRALELLDFGKAESLEQLEEQLCRMEEENRMTPEARQLIRPEVLLRFTSSQLGRRMAKAQQAGKLWRERQFVIGVSARQLGLADSGERVLIQGVIDAYLEEDGGLVLVDYKTDRAAPGQEAVLIERYRVQLEDYRMALEQMTGKPVKEQILYSLSLQKAIAVPQAGGSA